MSNIEKIIKQAIATFSRPQSHIKFQENLNSLMQNANKLTLKDVYLDKDFVNGQNSSQDKSNPITYVRVFEDLNVLISIFILKSNSVIPIHDHPLMHGILKVLSGSVHIQSYSTYGDNIRQRDTSITRAPNEYYYVEEELYSDPIEVRKNQPVTLNENDNCIMLTPTENNIHEIRSYNGPSAFIDILAPPYDTIVDDIGPRKCLYFEENKCVNGESTLSLLCYPPDYWTVEVPFKGPEIQVDDL